MSATFVSASGTVYPCCWIANAPMNKQYEQFIGSDFERINIMHQPLTEVLKDRAFHKVEESWRTANPFKGCQVFCGKPLDKSYGKMMGTNEYLSVKLNEPT